LNIATNLEWSARYFPERPAISQEGATTGYAELNQMANRVATALIDLKLQPGDHIGLCAPNSGEWIAFYFGALKAGAVPVTLSSQLSRDELSLLLNHSQPRMIFTSTEKLDCLEGFRSSGGLEKIICPGGDLDMKQLTEIGSASFKALDRNREDIAAILYTGGENVYPKEVEDVLYARPEVEECAIIGLPDAEWGEKVTAFIVARPGEKIDPGALKVFLKSRISAFKVPKEFRVVSELPKSPAGKILKRRLRKEVKEN
jgi:acyl-CoA synthetase (AMP-forming)/AMP-acid ligase II